MVSKEGVRGQVTIFIILGIIIVAAGFLIYSFYPQISTTLAGGQQTPQGYIQTCIEQDIKDTVDKLSAQGGSLAPENYLSYQNVPIEYLCYTTEYYRPCIVQQPALKQHIEIEIENATGEKVDSCFDSLIQSYERRGYNVNLERGIKRTELLPERIVSTFNYGLTLTKGEDTQSYDSFSVVLNNNLYELTGIAMSIIEWETLYGDSEPQIYMTYYPWLKVEKKVDESGEKIYILTDRDIGSKLQFAIRSQVWPAGYAISTVI